jgi:hypothetical protein
MGPGLVVFNLAAYKDFRLWERLTLQFRSEFFNAFNHTNPNGPTLATALERSARSRARKIRVRARWL